MTNLANVTRDPALESKLRHHLQAWGLTPSSKNGDFRAGGLTPIYAFRFVTSTMEIAHKLAGEDCPDGTLVWAQHQEQGRGRLGRTWKSPEGGVYFSIVLRPRRPLEEIPQLSLVAGLAAAEAIRELTPLVPTIRWPNDILIDGLKVAGILVELRGEAVVGVGINVTTKPKDLPETATSLVAAGVRNCDLYQLTGTVCRHFGAWYDVWAAQGLGPIREALRPWMGHFGQPVHVSAGSNHFEGTATDLDETGRLIVRLDSGLLRAFEMGEVTLLR